MNIDTLLYGVLMVVIYYLELIFHFNRRKLIIYNTFIYFNI